MAEDTAETVKNAAAVQAASDIESQVKEAMRSRIDLFRENSDSFTFEGVRRQIEKDLGLEKFALDVHKRFVKQLLLELLGSSTGNNVSKDSEEAGEERVRPVKGEATEQPEELESKRNKVEHPSESEEKMEDSPVLGLLTGHTKIESETKKSELKKKEALSESTIKKAMLKRASYFKANSENITLGGVRRKLEEDLKLKKYELDTYKKFISKQLDEVLKSSKASENKKKITKPSVRKASKRLSSEESSDSSDEESDEEEDVKPKKRTGPKQKITNSEGSKKRKRPEKEMKVSGKKRTRPAEEVTEDNSNAEDSGSASEDGQSLSSAEKPAKKKEPPTPAYGKRVEHLKSVIKSCGMSVPPVIYKKAKQVSESKREAQLIKELEDILSREGLSSNPSEKEIKEVRKRKERARELEGIDMSNIISSSRRRSATSYAPPPKPKLPVESDDDDSEDEDEDDEDNEDNEDEEDNGNEDEDDKEDEGDGDGDNNDDNNEEDGSQHEDLDDEPGEDSE